MKYHIERMAAELTDDEAIQKEFIGIMNTYWKDKVAVIWGIDDIIFRAESRGMEITEERAKGILDVIIRQHDATIGVTWDTIDVHLDLEIA